MNIMQYGHSYGIFRTILLGFLLLALSACSERADRPDAPTLERLMPQLIETRLQEAALGRVIGDIRQNILGYCDNDEKIQEISRAMVLSKAYLQGMYDIIAKDLTAKDSKDLLTLLDAGAMFGLGSLAGELTEKYAFATTSVVRLIPNLINAKAINPDFDLPFPLDLPGDSVLDRLIDLTIKRQLNATSEETVLEVLASNTYRRGLKDILSKFSPQEIEGMLAILTIRESRREYLNGFEGFLETLELAYSHEKTLLVGLIEAELKSSGEKSNHSLEGCANAQIQ